MRLDHRTLTAGIRPMADLADYYPAAQQVPQTMNGTQPAPVAGRGAAAPSGMAGAPALWVLIICAAGILLLHAGE